MLKSMCKESTECHEQASKRLLLPAPATQKRKAEESLSSNKKSKKDQHVTVIPRYEVCETCSKTFDVTTNNDEACRTHECKKYSMLLLQFEEAKSARRLFGGGS